MKLILNEDQYARLFNNKKRKLVINESQYNRLILEANTSSSMSDIDKTDTIQLTSGKNKLHFKVVAKSGHEIMMINCNDGVYKNAYFFMNGSALNSGSLTYQIAQAKDVDEKNPWETLGSNKNIWRKSTFKNITGFKVFNGGAEGLTCNLSNDAVEKFGINIETGSREEPELSDEEKAKKKKEKDEDEGEFDEKEEARKFRNKLDMLKSDQKWRLPLMDGDGDSKEENYIDVVVHNRGGKDIEMEMVNFTGSFGARYKSLEGKHFSLDSTQKVEFAKVPDSKKVLKSVNINVYINNDEGGYDKEPETISNIIELIPMGEYKTDKEGNEIVPNDGNRVLPELSDEEMKDLVKKLVTDNEYLKNAISSKPNHFLELIGLARKKGLLPISDRMDKWTAYWSKNANKNLGSERFGVDETITAQFDSFNTKNKELAANVDLRGKFKSKSLKERVDDKYTRLGTNMRDEVKMEETYKYRIYLVRELEDRDDYYIYEANLLYKKAKNEPGEQVGTGKLKVMKLKNKTKTK